jgi:hypothetical protein
LSSDWACIENDQIGAKTLPFTRIMHTGWPSVAPATKKASERVLIERHLFCMGKVGRTSHVVDAEGEILEHALTKSFRIRNDAIKNLCSSVRGFRDATIPLLMATLGLILTASHSHAGLGWTLAQFKQQYGKPVLNQEQIAGRIGYVFTAEDYIIAAFFLNRQVSRIMYICRNDSVFNWGRARALLRANAPDAIWADASKNEADNSYRVNGTKDGMETRCVATL